MPTQVSTQDVAAQERPAYWNFLVSSVLGRLNTIPQRRGIFNGSLAYASLSSLPIATVASSPVHVERRDAYIDNPEEDFYKINFILQGSASISQQNRSADISPGQWTIYDNTRPYDLRIHSDYKQLLLLIPRAQILSRFPAIDLFLAQPFDSARGMNKLFFGATRNALLQSDAISAEAQSHTAQMLTDLLTLCLSETSGHIAPAPSPTRFRQMVQFIEIHLHEENLGTDRLSKRFNLSKRAVQKLFAAHNTTVNQLIWATRIDKCKEDLCNPRLAHIPIHTIANSWGFRTASHFSRMFREHTGQSPKKFRQICQKRPLSDNF